MLIVLTPVQSSSVFNGIEGCVNYFTNVSLYISSRQRKTPAHFDIKGNCVITYFYTRCLYKGNYMFIMYLRHIL